jgi:D-arabinose 1-dehydrogenase-like Zn-dependent alcohol dehydrogenase
MIPDWLARPLGAVYTRTPPSLRPPLKQAFGWTVLRAEAVTKRRRVHSCSRIEFLDFEVAHLERSQFLGPGKGEALVLAHRSCVSPGTEAAVLRGLPGARRSFPYVPGYSTCGTVLSVGGGTSGIAPGSLVAGRMPHASHGIMSQPSLFKVPDGVSAEEASFIELGIITIQGIRKAAIRPGDRVAVVGQGLIGQLASRLVRVVGSDSVVAVANSRRRMTSALVPGGASEFIALSDGPGAVRDIAADVVVEAVGSARAITLAMEAARPGGTVVLLGSSRDLGRNLDWRRIAQKRN